MNMERSDWPLATGWRHWVGHVLGELAMPAATVHLSNSIPVSVIAVVSVRRLPRKERPDANSAWSRARADKIHALGHTSSSVHISERWCRAG